jgi:hypothetical protein
MNPTHHDDQAALDDSIRALLIERHDVAAARRERSFASGLRRLPLNGAPQRRRRWTLPRLVAITAAGAAVLLVIALAPSLDRHGSSGLPTLTSNASAAEALRWAGDAILAEGNPAVGSGRVWHAVSVTRKHGRLSGVHEQWLSTDDDTWEQRRVTRGRDKGIIDGHRGIVDWKSASVNSFDGNVQRSRGYRKPTADTPWQVASGVLQSDVTGGVDIMAPMIGGPPPRVVGRRVNGRMVPVKDPAPDASRIPPLRISATVTKEEGTRRWVQAASSSTDPDELKLATRIFLRTTRGHFIGLAADANPRARRATTIRQLVHLLTVARSTPEAAKVLYSEFAQMDDLKRLPNVRVHGRRAMRIQYDFADLTGTRDGELGGRSFQQQLLDETETVLVIDLETGAPLQTESLDRHISTELLPATRVDAIGTDAAICDDFFRGVVPCDALEGRGPLADRAQEIADSDMARQFAEQYGGGVIANLPNYATIIGTLRPMRLDTDALPLDDSKRPLGYARDLWGQRIPIYPLAELPED